VPAQDKQIRKSEALSRHQSGPLVAWIRKNVICILVYSIDMVLKECGKRSNPHVPIYRISSHTRSCGLYTSVKFENGYALKPHLD
jgi:hypothetical protein